MQRKYVFYLKDSSRGIVLTDNYSEKSIDEISKSITAMFSCGKFTSFTTETDCLIVNPFCVTAIHIQSSPEESTSYSKKPENVGMVVKNIVKKKNKIVTEKEIPLLDLDDELFENEPDICQTKQKEIYHFNEDDPNDEFNSTDQQELPDLGAFIEEDDSFRLEDAEGGILDSFSNENITKTVNDWHKKVLESGDQIDAFGDV